jgi:hypothetical protein
VTSVSPDQNVLASTSAGQCRSTLQSSSTVLAPKREVIACNEIALDLRNSVAYLSFFAPMATSASSRAGALPVASKERGASVHQAIDVKWEEHGVPWIPARRRMFGEFRAYAFAQDCRDN